MNVAEGHKQHVILESEGRLEAKSNEADAAYKTVFREAEARFAPPSPWHYPCPHLTIISLFKKEQAVMEASALANQVSAIAASLNPSNPGAEERKLALRTIKRLERLREIAKSGNNSTYFFGDRGEILCFPSNYNKS